MYRLFRILAVALLTLPLFPQTVRAFDITPTVSVIELPGNASGVTLVVRNPRNVDLPITTEVLERFVQEDGEERYESADDLFLVFPPQAIVPAGGAQSLRVQWLGTPPQASRSFTLFASEIPVDLSGAGGSQLQTILRMGASVHVAAAGAKPKPVLAATKQGDNGVSVTLANEGDRFFYIDSVTLDFAGKRLSGMELANTAGRTLVPPGARRTFRVAGMQGAPTLEAK